MTDENALPPKRLTSHSLWISDPSASLRFYCDSLGLQLRGECHERGSLSRYFLSFTRGGRWQGGRDFAHDPGTVLELLHEPQTPARYPRTGKEPARDGYWKIGLGLADVDRARRRLLRAGIEVGEATQFLDIGYLCHLADPDGYTIELLQHRFQQNQTPQTSVPGEALGSAVQLGQVTLRVRDANASLAFYRDCLGMRLLSRQVVAPYGFTLYFLACTAEALPVNDIDAVENREWLWQRPYTVLELQHFDRPEAFRRGRASGFERIGFAGASPLDHYAKRAGAVRGFDAYLHTAFLDVSDPDGYTVRVYATSV